MDETAKELRALLLVNRFVTREFIDPLTKRKKSPNDLRNKPELQRRELRRYKMSRAYSRRSNGFLQVRMAGMRKSNKKKVLKKKGDERARRAA